MNYANCVWCFDYNESALVMTIALSRYTIIGAMVADTSLLRFDTWLYLYIAFQMMKALSQPTYPYIVQNMGATQHRHTLIMCQIHRYTQLLYCSFVRHLFIVIQVVLVIKHWCQNDLNITSTNYHQTKARLVIMSDCHSLEAELIKMKTATCNTYLW